MATTIESNAIRTFLLEETGSETGTFYGKIPAARQREVFGSVLFGRRSVYIDGAAREVAAYRKVCFGTDYDVEIFEWNNA